MKHALEALQITYQIDNWSLFWRNKQKRLTSPAVLLLGYYLHCFTAFSGFQLSGQCVQKLSIKLCKLQTVKDNFSFQRCKGAASQSLGKNILAVVRGPYDFLFLKGEATYNTRANCVGCVSIFRADVVGVFFFVFLFWAL